jgi:acylphosphatase
LVLGGLPAVAGKEVEQREIYYSGRVQGVGFRFTARAIAAQVRVSGFVRNMPDGRVQLVVEGNRDAVQMFLDRVESEMGPYIRHKQVGVGPATGRFEGFDIRC